MSDHVSTSDRDPQSAPWFVVGTCAFVVVAIFLVANVLVLLGALGWSTKEDAIAVGLGFGQVGLVAAWAFSTRVVRRYRWILASYLLAVLGGVSCCYVTTLGWMDSTAVALHVLIFVAFNTVVLVLLFAHRWFWANVVAEQPRGTALRLPQFGVGHLLIAMMVVAVLGLTVRYALPEIGAFASLDVIVIIGQCAILSAAAGVLLLDRVPSLWRFGVLAGGGLVLAWLTDSIVDFDDAYYVNAIQVAVLGFGIVLPQLDHFWLRVHLEPRYPERYTDIEAGESGTE